MSHNCKQPREDLLAYVETSQTGLDGVSAEQCAEIDAHLEQCEACRNEVEQIKASLHSIREIPAPVVPRNLDLLVSDAIRRRRAKRSFFPVPSLAYACLALVLVSGTVLMLNRGAKVEDIVPTRTAQLKELVEEQQRWIIILSHTLKESEREELNQAGSYLLTRLDRSTQAFREGLEQGGLDPEMVPEYEQKLRQQINLLKEFYFQASSSS